MRKSRAEGQIDFDWEAMMAPDPNPPAPGPRTVVNDSANLAPPSSEPDFEAAINEPSTTSEHPAGTIFSGHRAYPPPDHAIQVARIIAARNGRDRVHAELMQLRKTGGDERETFQMFGEASAELWRVQTDYRRACYLHGERAQD